MKRNIWAFMLLFALLFALETTVCAESAIEDFKEGFRLFKEAKNSEARVMFRRVQAKLRSVPDKKLRQQCSAMIREVNYATILRMLRCSDPDVSVRKDIRGFAQWIMSETKGVLRAKVTNKSEIRKALIKAIRDHDPVERLRWVDVVRTRFGEFAVPEIHSMFLHCGNEEVMGRSVDLLVQMGAQVVMASIELFKSENAFDRLHAARVLGELADRRAIPVLVDHFRYDDDVTVKKECQYALEKILDMDLEGKERALAYPKDYYYSLALQYYHQLPTLIYGRLDTFVVWRWVYFDEKDHSRGGRLDYDPNIPLWAYMDICAEDLVLSSLESVIKTSTNPDDDSTFENAWNLLIAINIRQHLEEKSRFKY